MTDPTSPYPASEPAERGLLASFLHSPAKTYQLCLSQGASPEWFSEEDRSTLFSVFMDMGKEGRQIDLITVVNWILDHKVRFNTPVPDALIGDLLGFIPNATLVADYLGIVKKHAVRKLGIMVCQETERKLREECADLQSVFDACSAPFAEVQGLCVEEETEDYDQRALLEFLDEMEAIAAGKAKPEFFPTGLRTIDEECGGLVRGELMMIQGRSGCGKSILSQKIVSTNAFSEKQARTAIFTYEMPFQQYVSRLVADLGSVQLNSMRNGRYSKAELDSFNRSMTKIISSKIRIYDTFRLKGKRDPKTFFSWCRTHAKQYGLDIAVCDHAHLMEWDGKTEKKQHDSMSEFFANFKSLCLELKCTGIVLAQENTDGNTFGCSQASTHADSQWGMVPVWKMVGGNKKIVGVSGVYCNKARQGNLLGRTIPIKLDGAYARISEPEPQAVRASENEF